MQKKVKPKKLLFEAAIDAIPKNWKTDASAQCIYLLYLVI